MSNKLIIIIGPAGCGKSTLSNTLTRFENICEADKYPNLYKNGIINIDLLNTAHETCKKDVENKMIEKIKIIVQSNTNLELGDKGIRPYIILAKKYNYNIEFILPNNDLLYFTLPNEETKNTIERRLLQIQHLKNSRSEIGIGKEGYKNISSTIIDKMIFDYDKLKSIFIELQKYSNPIEILDKLNQSV